MASQVRCGTCGSFLSPSRGEPCRRCGDSYFVVLGSQAVERDVARPGGSAVDTWHTETRRKWQAVSLAVSAVLTLLGLFGGLFVAVITGIVGIVASLLLPPGQVVVHKRTERFPISAS